MDGLTDLEDGGFNGLFRPEIFPGCFAPPGILGMRPGFGGMI